MAAVIELILLLRICAKALWKAIRDLCIDPTAPAGFDAFLSTCAGKLILCLNLCLMVMFRQICHQYGHGALNLMLKTCEMGSFFTVSCLTAMNRERFWSFHIRHPYRQNVFALHGLEEWNHACDLCCWVSEDEEVSCPVLFC